VNAQEGKTDMVLLAGKCVHDPLPERFVSTLVQKGAI